PGPWPAPSMSSLLAASSVPPLRRAVTVRVLRAAVGQGGLDPPHRGEAAEAFVEVLELVERVAVPREVELAALVELRHRRRQLALLAEIRAAAVEGAVVLEGQVLVLGDGDGERVGGAVELLLVHPPRQQVIGLARAHGLAEGL